ncbi:hypothetical protein QEN19_000418 [Hanseniaspora menglaensis]
MSEDYFNLSEQLKHFNNNSLEDLQIGYDRESIQDELYELIDTITLQSTISLGNPKETDWEKFITITYNYDFLQQKQKLALINGLKSGIMNACKEINYFYNQMNKDSEQDEHDIAERREQEIKLKKGLQIIGFMSMVCLSTIFHQMIQRKSDKQLLDETVSCFQTFIPCLMDLFEINLSRLFSTTVEKSEFIQLFSKTYFLILEVESIYKSNLWKESLQKIFCLLVKLQNEKHDVLSMVTNNISYFSFSINFFAEFLKQLYDEYDYPQFTEDVLRTISEKEFNAKDVAGPKNVALFLVKLSELAPQAMMKQIQLVTRLLNNSSFTLRNSVVEACGNIVYTYYKNKSFINDTSLIEAEEEQCSLLIDLLEERFLDTNPFVRSKAVQGLIKLANLKSFSKSKENELPAIVLTFQRRKMKWTKIAVRSIQDKSYLVRRYCIKLISIILLNHPFTKLHGSQLKLTDWQTRKSDSQNAYEKLSEAVNESDEESYELMRDTLGKLKLTIQYYTEAIEYIELLHRAVEQCSKLLSSKNKSEVIEAMDFFVLCDAYDLETSYMGIKKMLHLIWHQTDDMPKLTGLTNASNALTKNVGIAQISIPQHLVTCYKHLFLTAPEDCNSKEKAAYIAKNLINLTINAGISDLASLEKILSLLYREKVIDQNVIKVLWIIFNSFQREDTAFTENQIHGSIIILGMLANEDHNVVIQEIDTLLSIGLINNSKDYVLAKYTCIAMLKSLSGNKIKSLSPKTGNVNIDSEKISIAIQNKLIEYSEDPSFYPFAESAIECIFKLSDLPDLYCKVVIEKRSKEAFSENQNDKSFSRIASVSQLLFIVGEIVLKLIVYLEYSEMQFKKMKNQKETDAKVSKDQEKDRELEMISKTNEDDFNDSIAYIRETELLFSPQSLLSQFIPFVINLLTEHEYTYSNFFIQRIALLTLLKFMLTSKKICEKYLSLLITIMEKSEDPITRSNCILGFGDISVTFNTIIDDNIEFLYNRLMDRDLSVKRTCLMTITFLILAGQVKIKGQLGKMALCLIDDDLKIVQLSKIFFNELNSKDNAVYNGFLDIFNYLSNIETLSENDFQKIVKFLMNYIHQEKYQKNINNKLIGKLKTVETEKQFNDIVYVLQHLINNKDENLNQIVEEGFKKIP